MYSKRIAVLALQSSLSIESGALCVGARNNSCEKRLQHCFLFLSRIIFSRSLSDNCAIAWAHRSDNLRLFPRLEKNKNETKQSPFIELSRMTLNGAFNTPFSPFSLIVRTSLFTPHIWLITLINYFVRPLFAGLCDPVDTSKTVAASPTSQTVDYGTLIAVKPAVTVPLPPLSSMSLEASDLTKTTEDKASASSSQGPHFVPEASKNVTALAGRVASLNCRIKNLDNRTVILNFWHESFVSVADSDWFKFLQ